VQWADSIILAWGLAYIIVAFVRPDIVLSVAGRKIPKFLSFLINLAIGLSMVLNLFLENMWIYVALGFFEANGLVMSWVGLIRWNTTLNQDLANLSMALLDYLGSIVLFMKVIG